MVERAYKKYQEWLSCHITKWEDSMMDWLRERGENTSIVVDPFCYICGYKAGAEAERDKYRELLEQVVCAGNANLVCASVRQPLLKKIDQALKEERDV